MTFELRPYQQTMIDQIRAALREHRTVVAVAPTGSGKTALAAFMIGTAANRGRRVWMTVHRDFLVAQTAGALDRVGVEYGYIAAGHPYNPHKAVHVVSIQTLVRRYTELTPPDLLVIDECHHARSRTWAKIHEWAGSARHVGLTATPIRLDGRGLGTFYRAMVLGPAPAWLIARGYLSTYRAFAPGVPDLDDVPTEHGDYAPKQLAKIMDTSQIVGDAVGQYRRQADGKKAIYYGVSVAHSEHICAGFLAAGIPARHLDAGSSSAERAGAAIDLAAGRLSVITNCDLFGEGYDLSAQAGGDVTVEAVGLLRPTKSLTLHLQQIGRALRPKDEPAIILDHAGNIVRHGLPDDERQWSLEDRKKRAGKDNGPAITICKECFGAYRASLDACPYCGAPREVGEKPRKVTEVAENLVEVDREMLKHTRRREMARAETLEELIAIGAARGYQYPAGWARHVLRARMKEQYR
jgi:superfamily II DNA or RNA helicase